MPKISFFVAVKTSTVHAQALNVAVVTRCIIKDQLGVNTGLYVEMRDLL